MVAVGVLIYLNTLHMPVCGTYRKVTYSVSYNSTENSIGLFLTSWVNQTYVFNQVIVKDSKGQVVDIANIDPVQLHAYHSVNVTINLNSGGLESGQNYDVELNTVEGESYRSYLTIYENVKTQVSLASANTLLVDIQSQANQTIVFDRATINGWSSYGMDSVETTFSPRIELLPNHNASFTIPYENGFSYGNYSLILHNSSPPSVDGAWNFFIVNGTEECFNRVATIEKIAFQADNSALLVDIQSLSNETISFTGATIKESNGYIYRVIARGNPTPAELPPYENWTITVRLNVFGFRSSTGGLSSFGPGNYIVTLDCGENALWARFNVP